MFPFICGSRFAIALTLLSLLPSPARTQKLDFTNLTLIETTYNSVITSLESSNNVSTKYTLSEFLTNVVAKSGFSTTKTVQDDQKLRNYDSGFRWDPDDEANSTNWTPTAVSTWQDTVFKPDNATLEAVDDAWKGVTVVSWKDTATKNKAGVRVTFVVNGTSKDGGSRKYAHVLLVDNVAGKKAGGVSFDIIDPKAIGGMVWHRGWLYVGDGTNGLRVFDVNHIWKVDAKSAFGMEYIMPQARLYYPSDFPSYYRSFTFHFLSIDRSSTPPCLLVGEYEDNRNYFTYLAKWPLDGTNGRLATDNIDGKLIAFANWGYKISILRVQGMIWAHDTYFIARLAAVSAQDFTADPSAQGELFIWAPGGKYVDPIQGVLPRGVGGLSYSPDRDEMWALGAADGSRGVVGINAGAYIDMSGNPTPKPTATQQTKAGDSTPTPTSGTSNDGTTPGESTKSSTGAIAGGVIGGIIAGALLLWLFIMYRRHKASRDSQRQLTSQGADQYPPPGFVYGTDGYQHKAEIPMLKSELDGSSAQVEHGGYAAAVARSMGSKEHIGDLQEWESQNTRMPRRPVPVAMPTVYNPGDGRGEGQWVELPAIERRVEAP